MLEDRKLFLNGDLISWKEAQVHLMSHSFARGSAIFEVLGFHEVDSRPAVFRLDQHIERLLKSAQHLDMELPYSGKELHDAVLETVKQNSVMQGMIKIICYYSRIVFEVLPPKDKLDVAIFVVVPSEDVGGIGFSFEQGTTACVSKWRKLDPETVPVEAKVAANYLNGMVARQEAKKGGFEYPIMLDTQGFIAEGPTESLFLVKDGKLLVPALGTVLQSISRKSILEVAAYTGIEFSEQRLAADLLYEADEMFFSATAYKVLPVRKVEDREVPSAPGPVSRKLYEVMNDIITGKNDHFKEWLFAVK
ncbi:MAG: branched-chain-amino-acid transaminase [Deltaproteobacteria bacterium]|nr:branched-chain-amino-acid transaminase [Deltaproteobacteria bacterium]MBW2045563.1 branched-chain-amino-acid transaminase [Deltaproteobacteria bacterium]MBW2301347.1 branched-chain-amino-acid transaminase [Deltaproteobacteria bacterium]